MPFRYLQNGCGEVILDGKKIEINNPDEAMKYGIAMVHQELQPVPARSVAENLYLGRFPTKGFGPFKMIDHKTMYAETERWLKEVKWILIQKHSSVLFPLDRCSP